MDISKIVEKLHNRLIVPNTNPQKYRILKNYEGTYIADVMKKEEKMVDPIFRIFKCVRPEKGRKLNIDPEHEFDPYSDSLMDYPSIIGYKLEKKWTLFNRLVSVHLPLCPNNCWHCYLPKKLYENAEDRSESLTAKKIVDKFLQQQRYDETQGKHTNILRITGGEPFLLPKLILECLLYLRKKGFEDKVFLWTETNLEPFVGEEGTAFMDQEENKEILTRLNNFRNFAVHPCFHGLDKEELNTITGKNYNISLDQQVKGLKRLVNENIDVYPTFGSNVCNPSNIRLLFEKLKELRPNLPLRVALVEYKLDYEPVPQRFTTEPRRPRLYSKFTNLRIWNQLLLKSYGIGYAMMPRHIASIASDASSLSKVKEVPSDQTLFNAGENILYFFKGSFRERYHREILETLALPPGHIYEIDYDKKWVQEDLYFHIGHIVDSYKGRRVIWSYVNKKDYKTLLPLREATIIDANTSDSVLSIKLKLGKYLIFPNKKEETLDDLTTNIFKSYFGSKNIPPGGKYVLLGEDSILSSSSNRVTPQLRDDPEVLHHITPHLILFDRMKCSLFYRITTENLMQKAKSASDPTTVYEIRGGKSFKIKFNYYLPNYSEFNERKPEQRTIHFQSSSETVTPIGENKLVLSKYGCEELEFLTNKVSKKEIITLIFWSKYDEFSAAKTVLHIRVLPPKLGHKITSLLSAMIFLLTTASLAIASQALANNESLAHKLLSSMSNLFGATWWLNIFVIIGYLIAFWLSFLLVPKKSS